MELFQVRDKSKGNARVAGAASKKEARIKRDELQAKTKEGMPPPEKRDDPSAWQYTVGLGSDHRNYGL